ncbi:hypothetical protein BpHYR1_037976 [Brachionus plicatilis]|uniref:Uncharacterized protein n=1 Tax=Brachionus plicatilis TaxID=10195 RepID=A0A3M7QMD3_BRAPC|nr:hypothetical protein BpHYR1_037976 [Brachionus plicatilis]
MSLIEEIPKNISQDQTFESNSEEKTRGKEIGITSCGESQTDEIVEQPLSKKNILVIILQKNKNSLRS